MGGPVDPRDQQLIDFIQALAKSNQADSPEELMHIAEDLLEKYPPSHIGIGELVELLAMSPECWEPRNELSDTELPVIGGLMVLTPVTRNHLKTCKSCRALWMDMSDDDPLQEETIESYVRLIDGISEGLTPEERAGLGYRPSVDTES